jgi:diguanylate cyclase (GGDEF)-like protein
MAEDIRYAELRFLQMLPSGTSEPFSHNNDRIKDAVGLHPTMYFEMILTLIEELYIHLDNDKYRSLVSRLRGEAGGPCPGNMLAYQWNHPREELVKMFQTNEAHRMRLTYRGLRRIEELREILARDRILEPFGVLLSMQYFRADLEQALRLGSDVSVSVLYADMDHFKRINSEFGQSAGDVVMKAYLEVVHKEIGLFGSGYRGVGDEVAVLIKGQGHDKAIEFAEKIRRRVKALKCLYEGHELPGVSASIGVASTPPEDRKMELETVAEGRKRKAKEQGRNRVVSV